MSRLRRDHDAAPPYPGEVLARELWTRTRVGLGARGTPLDWAGTFGRDARRVVDLGCGNGRWLIHSALERRDVDHVGIDLVPPAIKLASLRAGQRGLTNLKFAWGDATEFILERALGESLDEVHLYHPQPYYDPAKKARRQLTPAVLLAIWRALRPGGIFVFQTDNSAFARYARKIAGALFEWRELATPWPDAPRGRTLREIQARARGLAIVRAEAIKLALDASEAERRVASLPEPDFDADRPAFAKRRGARTRRPRR
jgi:tRNA (guanine-N7-)-methyltransferase